MFFVTFLFFVPVLGLIVGVGIRSVAVQRGWVRTDAGPAKLCLVLCFVAWGFGPILWPVYALPLIVEHFGEFLMERFAGEVGLFAQFMWLISALPFIGVGGLLGWQIGPDRSSWQARVQRQDSRSDTFAEFMDADGEPLVRSDAVFARDEPKTSR